MNFAKYFAFFAMLALCLMGTAQANIWRDIKHDARDAAHVVAKGADDVYGVGKVVVKGVEKGSSVIDEAGKVAGAAGTVVKVGSAVADLLA